MKNVHIFHFIVFMFRCCSELRLRSGEITEFEIQFQLNRLHFCQMHYALDQLENTDFVFPDISKINQTWIEKQALQLRLL